MAGPELSTIQDHSHSKVFGQADHVPLGWPLVPLQGNYRRPLSGTVFEQKASQNSAMAPPWRIAMLRLAPGLDLLHGRAGHQSFCAALSAAAATQGAEPSKGGGGAGLLRSRGLEVGNELRGGALGRGPLVAGEQDNLG